jgi:uncharacterized membrane protein required for colicin V production
MEILVNMLICLFIAGITYALMSEGLWGAALMFFNVLFAGILAFDFYEPLAALLSSNVEFSQGFADMVCLMSLFIVALFILRFTTESLAPAMIRFPTPIYHLGRFFFGLMTAMMTMAILLLSFETAPVHKKVFGVIDYKTQVPFGLGLDRKWLSFFQHTTGLVFADDSSPKRDPLNEYGNAKLFDPRGEWLLYHQEARPYGTESILSDEGGSASSRGGTTSAGGGQGGPRVIMPGWPGGGAVVPR